MASFQAGPDKQGVLLPSNSPGTIQETVELFEILLSFLQNPPDPDVFLFWWGLLKQQYLVVFYPSIWPAKTQAGKIGFPKCPEEIQSVFVKCLQQITIQSHLLEILFKGDDNKQLMLEVFKQSIALHVNYDDTIRNSMSVFNHCYLTTPPEQISKAELGEYRQAYISGLADILTSKSSWDSGDASKKHETLCLAVIEFFKKMFQERQVKDIDEKTQEAFFFTMLRTASEVLSPTTSSPHLAGFLHGVLLDAILFIWILVRPKNPAHWEALCQAVSGLFHTMETVVQVGNKVLQLTMVLQEKIYYVKKQTKKKTPKRPGMMGGEQSAKNMVPKSPDSIDPPVLPPRDEAIRKIDWTVEDIHFVWMNMLNIYSNINNIRSPSIHVATLENIWQVIESILWSEGQVPYEETLNPERPPPLCVINIFGKLLFQACDLPSAFVDGKAQAYKILCRIFCRDHIHPLPESLLAHFYGAIQEGLTNRDNKNTVQDSIICNSSGIFSKALPGANILIPYYLTETHRILTGEGRGNAVKERAIIILCSLLCFSSHFKDVKLPAILEAKESKKGKDKGRGTGPAPIPDFSSLLQQVLGIITDSLKIDHKGPIIQVRMIWAVSMSLFEILITQQNGSLVPGLVATLLKHISGTNRVVVRAAIHAITSLTAMGDQFKAYPSIISTVVESVAANVQKELSDFRNKSLPVDEPLIADQLYCLLEWLLVYGDHVCDHVKLIGKVCDALESALVGVVKGDATMGSSTRQSHRKRKSGVARPSTTDEAPFEVLYAAAINVVDPTTVMLPQVREAAENVVLHLLHHLHNVPDKGGIDILTSFINDTDDVGEGEESKCLHFVHNDNVLFSFVEVPTPTEAESDDKKEEGDKEGEVKPKSFSRVIVRNSTGKYSWDTTRLFDYEKMDELVSLPFQFETDGVVQTPPVPRGGEVPLAPKPTEEHPEIPHHTNTYKSETDQLDVLLHYLSNTHPDCLPEGIKTLNVPADCAETQKKRIDYTEQNLVLQIEEDEQVMQKMQENVPPPQYWDMACPVPQLPIGTYHYCRTLLSHLGLLSCDNLGAISLLTGDPEKVERSLTQLDRTISREVIKVGIIYLKEGQEEQYGVLANDASDRTPLFYEFVRSVGWPIDLETHRAYLGGLDPKLTTGVTAPYFASSTTEIVFHDITSMPTSSSEPGQIHKKRHVGNDNVHVVWTEHLRDYNPRTIISEFNDVHIVVYPLLNGLFKIHVFQKENVELFGPLMHGMCVTKESLPFLIRATCVMANKYVRYTFEGYETPYRSRKKVLSQIVERHKAGNGFRELIGSVF